MSFNIIIKNSDHAGRDHDINQLKEMEKSGYGGMERMARKTAERIKKEDHLVRSMRESLIKAHRNNNQEEIKDIHEYIKNKSRYKNG